MRRLFDIGVIAILLGYVWLAQRTAGGAADPVWSRAAERGVLIVGTDIGFAPFVTYGQSDDAPTGYDVELVEEIARRLGWRVEWRQVGYDALFSAIDGANPNQVDALAAAIVLNPAEGWRARFSQPYFDGGQQIVVPISSTIDRLDDLRSPGDQGPACRCRVAVQLGSPGETALRSHVGDGIVVVNSAETQEQAVEMALNGEVDAAVVDNPTALPFIHRGQARSAGGLTFEPFVIVTPAAAYQLRGEIDRILRELQDEGWMARLNQRWFK